MIEVVNKLFTFNQLFFRKCIMKTFFKAIVRGLVVALYGFDSMKDLRSYRNKNFANCWEIFDHSEEELRLEVLQNNKMNWLWVYATLTNGLTPKIAYRVASNPDIGYVGQCQIVDFIKKQRVDFNTNISLAYGLLDNPKLKTSVAKALFLMADLPAVYSRVKNITMIPTTVSIKGQPLKDFLIAYYNGVLLTGDATVGNTFAYPLFATALSAGMKPQQLSNFNFVFSEAFTNAIEHGLLGLRSEELIENSNLLGKASYVLDMIKDKSFDNDSLILTFSLSEKEKCLRFTLEDSGMGHNPNHVVKPVSFTGRGKKVMEILGAVIDYNTKGNKILVSYKF